ncbi:hypothetical protein GCM10007425_04590 [Lysinibacillus alkalisoli]|uniref:PilZ domain-containing protein n=1 Tax=Lysinibacillus alkalisoli TaxID=1911548 RepID=A0A917D8S8_9BACI|nr:PilZ domain-containing protein [Lysinibacillus alkalisoli]GGG13378.1 hypothetical protein GCM10007425_04590 [Lysinibacillus alkalisoli]
MVYRRNESFRYTFPEIVVISGVLVSELEHLNHKEWKGHIVDISPQGMKVVSDLQLTETEIRQVQLESNFRIDANMIKGYAEIRWYKSYGGGQQLGLYFHEQAEVEGKIIDDLKSRRRKEVLRSKA